MHSDKHYADFQAQIASRSLSYSPEVSAALYSHARRLRAVEMTSLIGRTLHAVKTRVAASFTKTPAVATR